jgi:hypothetical protein
MRRSLLLCDITPRRFSIVSAINHPFYRENARVSSLRALAIQTFTFLADELSDAIC